MQGSSWSYVPHGLPARSINKTDRGFVTAFVVSMKDTSVNVNPLNKVRSFSKSKELTCPHCGQTLPQLLHVVRPILVSCLKGTPIITSCFATLAISAKVSNYGV